MIRPGRVVDFRPDRACIENRIWIPNAIVDQYGGSIIAIRRDGLIVASWNNYNIVNRKLQQLVKPQANFRKFLAFLYYGKPLDYIQMQPAPRIFKMLDKTNEYVLIHAFVAVTIEN